MPHDCSTPQVDQGVYAFDARGVDRRFRRAAISGALSALTAGATMRFYNDHDPLPLLQQLSQHFGARLHAAYLTRGPGEVIIDFKLVS